MYSALMNDEEDKPPLPLSFDDIELWDRVYLGEREAWVTEKGKETSPRSGRHIRVEFRDNKNQFRKEAVLKDTLVNQYLRKRKRLWVDWGGRLDPYVNENNA